MAVISSIDKVSSIRLLFFFFYFPYIYKNKVLAYFQTRPEVARKVVGIAEVALTARRTTSNRILN